MNVTSPEGSATPCDHVWPDYFWTSKKFPNHPMAIDGFTYWQRCRDCDTTRNPEPIVLCQSDEPLVSANATYEPCFLCYAPAVVMSAAIAGQCVSRYPLCGPCLETEARDRRSGKRRNHA